MSQRHLPDGRLRGERDLPDDPFIAQPGSKLWLYKHYRVVPGCSPRWGAWSSWLNTSCGLETSANPRVVWLGVRRVSNLPAKLRLCTFASESMSVSMSAGPARVHVAACWYAQVTSTSAFGARRR